MPSSELPVNLLAYPLTPAGTLAENFSPLAFFSQPDPASCLTDSLIASPHGRYVAVQYNCEADLFVRIFDWHNPGAEPATGTRGYFMDWSPDGNWFLFRQTDEQQVWLVAAAGNPQTLLPLPAGTYDATFWPDGQHITFAISTGLGQGTRLGILDLADNSQTIQQFFPGQTIASPRWSPDGSQLAYILMADSNTPYTVGELWLAGAQGEPAVRLDEVDAGHGYPPVWSPDGETLTYIKRENPNSTRATYYAELLHSNIYQVDIHTGTVIPLTQFNETLVYDPVWSPDGQQLAFTAGDAVWLLQPGESPVAISPPGLITRHPVWLVAPAS